MLTYNSYRFRIYPDKEQEEQLFRTIGCARKTYNLMLDSYKKLYADYKSGSIDKDEYRKSRRMINPSAFKREYSFLGEVDSTALKYAKIHCDSAYDGFFKGKSGFPKFKKRNNSTLSYSTCRASKTAKNLRLQKGGHLVLPKIRGTVRTTVTRNPRGTLLGATITKERTGKWYVSLRYEHHASLPKKVLIPTSPVGVDMGIKSLAVLSDGCLYPGMRSSYVYREKIVHLDKIISKQRNDAKRDGRKISECSNYRKNLVKRSRLFDKVKNIRKDNLHKITTEMINKHDFIGMENLSTANMMKNHCLAFAISDASWHEFKSMLLYKSERHGSTVMLVDKFFASTQRCSHCHKITGPKGINNLSVRQWTCDSCHSDHDRDVNAAVNILTESLIAYYTSEITAGTAGEEDEKLLQSLINKLGLPDCSQEKSSSEDLSVGDLVKNPPLL